MLNSIFRLACAIAAVTGLVAGASNRAHAAPVDLLNDNFNTENGGTYVFNYNGFANFDVTRGSVDLVPDTDPRLAIPGHGLFVDLDGTTNAAGKMESKTLFNLAPGQYTLSFDIAGSQRAESPIDSATVSLGGLFTTTITLPFDTPFATQVFTFSSIAASNGRLIFDATGTDNQGLLLDNVRLQFDPTPVPEPASIVLWGLGAIAVTGYERRRRSAAAKNLHSSV